MTEPSLVKMESERKEGFRPGVVVCLLFEKKLLMVYQMEYKLWQIPQGGVDPGETVQGAVLRVVGDELSDDLIDKVDINMEVFGESKMEFLEGKRGDKKIELDDGKKIEMKGKIYYFVAVKVLNDEIDISKSEFSIYRWVNMVEAEKLIDKIYQSGKQRVTREIVDGLVGRGFIS